LTIITHSDRLLLDASSYDLVKSHTAKQKTLIMSNQTTLNDASASLAQLCEQVVSDRDVVIITRQEGESVAIIAVEELNSLLETAYLLRSPKNATRLLTALSRAKARTLEPQSINELRQELGIGEEKEE
jgi:antitoxin YefM